MIDPAISGFIGISDPVETEDKKTEYLLVTDTTSEVIKSSTDRHELKKLATLIRKAGGEVTIFKATEL